MLRLGRSATSMAEAGGGLVTSAVRSSLRQQLQQRGARAGRALLSAYQTQSRRAPAPSSRAATPLGLAFIGAAALSVGLELESAAHARAAIEPAHASPHQAPHQAPRQRRWHLFDQIGSGAFGTVHIGMDEDSGEVAAVKIVPMENPRDMRVYPALEREVAALKLVKALGGHHSIVDLRDVYVDGRKVCVVTELARGGELFDQIVAFGSFPESRARDVAREMASALGFLHRHGLVHKDVKPENILLSARETEHASVGVFRKGHRHGSTSLVKLADFGSAGPASVGGGNADDIGTGAYQPPELLASGLCTSASDMWALGCVLYIMLSGSHPFDLDGLASDEVVEQRIKTEPVTFAFAAWEKVSADAKDLIAKLLEKDPSRRLTADQMLVHPWVVASSEASSARSESGAGVNMPGSTPTLRAGERLMSPA